MEAQRERGWMQRERGWMYRVSRGHTVDQRCFLCRHMGRAERRAELQVGKAVTTRWSLPTRPSR